MSRILVEGNFQGKIIPVVLGWDRPLKNCFVQFELTDEQYEDPTFAPVVRAVLASSATQMDYEAVVTALVYAQVTVPNAAMVELRLHAQRDAGNEIVSFGSDGERVLLMS